MFEKLISELQEYEKRHQGESQTVHQFLLLLRDHPDCISRNCLEGHLTASAWLENREETRFLLTKHKKFGRWIQLGGHVEGTADILSESFREIHEESGLTKIIQKQDGIFDLGIYSIPPFKNEPAHVHYDIRYFFKSLEPDDAIQISDESEDLAWFEVPPEESGDLKRMWERWKGMEKEGRMRPEGVRL